jgi:L-fuculose-phosphate aldolase
VTLIHSGGGTSSQALKGVTPIVKPGDSQNTKGCSCNTVPSGNTGSFAGRVEPEHLSKVKEEIIAEVVRRVTEQLN